MPEPNYNFVLKDTLKESRLGGFKETPLRALQVDSKTIPCELVVSASGPLINPAYIGQSIWSNMVTVEPGTIVDHHYTETFYNAWFFTNFPSTNHGDVWGLELDYKMHGSQTDYRTDDGIHFAPYISGIYPGICVFPTHEPATAISFLVPGIRGVVTKHHIATGNDDPNQIELKPHHDFSLINVTPEDLADTGWLQFEGGQFEAQIFWINANEGDLPDENFTPADYGLLVVGNPNPI